jgi:hypothetical protein
MNKFLATRLAAVTSCSYWRQNMVLAVVSDAVVAASATGDWATHDGKLARWNALAPTTATELSRRATMLPVAGVVTTAAVRATEMVAQRQAAAATSEDAPMPKH